MDSFYFNDRSKPFLSVLLAYNAQQEQPAQGEQPNDDDLSESQVREVVSAFCQLSAEEARRKQREEAQLEQEELDKEPEDGGVAALAPASSYSSASADPRELARMEQEASAELERERGDRQQRLDSLPQLELKRFSLPSRVSGIQAEQPQLDVHSITDKENSSGGGGSNSKAVGTAEDDGFRARLQELNRMRDSLLHQIPNKKMEQRTDLLEDLATLRKSLDVLKAMLAQSQEEA